MLTPRGSLPSKIQIWLVTTTTTTTTTMTTSWLVGCQPDMLNEYGSLVKDRKERVETRYARIYARSPTVINHFQTRARTMRVVPPESARSGDLLLPPTLSPRFCFRSPKPFFKRIEYASIILVAPSRSSSCTRVVFTRCSFSFLDWPIIPNTNF